MVWRVESERGAVKLDGMTLAQMFRRSCTGCGAEGLIWHEGREFATTTEGRALLVDVVANAGGHLSMAGCLNGQVWVCRACGELGVFL
jgi:hypothetical protein